MSRMRFCFYSITKISICKYSTLPKFYCIGGCDFCAELTKKATAEVYGGKKYLVQALFVVKIILIASLTVNKASVGQDLDYSVCYGVKYLVVV